MNMKYIVDQGVPFSKAGFNRFSDCLIHLFDYQLSTIFENALQRALNRQDMQGGGAEITEADIENALDDLCFTDDLIASEILAEGMTSWGSCPVCQHGQELQVEKPIDLVLDKKGVEAMEICLRCDEVSPISEWKHGLP